MELTWEQNKEQLNRQLAWQTVRSEFYSNLQWQNKNTAAHNRAYGDIKPESSLSAAKKLKNLDEMNDNVMSGNEFYNKVVMEIDRRIKDAQRNGAADQHIQALDEANQVIGKMSEFTTYGCYEKI